MNLLLLMVAVGLAGASPLPDSKVCQPHSRPWMVHIQGDGISCSGALISESWIVTSFDCAYGLYKSIASLGEHDVSEEEGTEQHIKVADVIIHSPYRSPLHSLAMVLLAEPARFNQHVQPIPLPSRCPRPGETCHVSGWGTTVSNQYEDYEYLKCISVPVVDDQTCMNTFPEYLYWSPGMVCAGRNDTDNCLNDAASVMVCDGQLQGIQWFRHGCYDPADPSVYTKMCLYNDWIREVMDRHAPFPTTTTPPWETA
ncbi:trypsinogen-like protein 3 [Cheilinus undulatus]|uniref:trypsinogen-like protein 3 n=1 Tax=Cheilinus undulatus TaxID=241271 RepID=UPI001BD61970|nr:trypsinogen-like protein 3 [Cheilinus undulatus]